MSLVGSPLVVPGVELLDQGEEVRAQRAVELTSPAAVAAREASRTKYSRLSTGGAARLAAKAFGGIVTHPAGGPDVPPGTRVTRYLSDRAAVLKTAGGRTAIAEAFQPIAARIADGRRVPLDLGLRSTTGGFAAADPAVSVTMPHQLGDGIALGGLGITFTPVTSTGAPLGGAQGLRDGASVLYANTATDTDTLVRPTPGGFDLGAVLRSVDSPADLRYRVALPRGASLSQPAPEGAIEIIRHRAVLATIAPAEAEDAAGQRVATHISLSGKVLVVHVDHRAGDFLYPVYVDPEVNDSQLTESAGKRSNWSFHASSGRFSGEANIAGGYLTTKGSGHATSEWAYWGYQTQGVSHIWEFSSESEAHNKGAGIEGFVELEAPGGSEENKILLSAEATGTSEYARRADPVLCPKAGCVPTSGSATNAVHFQQSATNTQEGKAFSDTLFQGVVSLAEPAGTHATSTYNTSSTEFEFEAEPEPGKKEKVHRANVLLGPGSWLSKYKGAFETVAKDPGIGVSDTKLELESSPGVWELITEHNYLESEKACQGVQCYPEHREIWTLSPRLPNGADKIRYTSRDAMPGTESLAEEGIATLKVDHAAPHDVVIKGLPFSNEIREAPYEITAEASDGEGPEVAAPGIKSISLYVDGREVGKPGGACSVAKGECRGSAKWTINGSELGAGTASLVVVVVDNAGNETRHGELVTVTHSKPVSLGPGSLDLESGDFTLSNTDASMGAGLSVSRLYSSRAVSAGSSGPLGPQWSFSLGSAASLAELGEGSVELTSSNGSQALFVDLGPGKGYLSPLGDSNLTLSVEENEQKTQKVAYYLTDASAHTKVKFTRPGSANTWLPTRQEGQTATDTVTYSYTSVQGQNGTITVPSEALAPVPAGVSCSWTHAPIEMHAGCRALEFKYATATTAGGEAESEWGEFTGRLARVSLVAFNPAAHEMQEVPIDQYAYDKQGRLRAQWDPRISPALKNVYGYDAEGHVTAFDPPGVEPWVFTYGTSSADAGGGRLVKVYRAPVVSGTSEEETQAKLKQQKQLLSNTGKPAVEGSPLVGVRLTATNGTWSGGPLVYRYQWQDCNAAGQGCLTIPGANSANYTVQKSDAGHTLIAVVSALNGSGAVAASSAPTLLAGEPERRVKLTRALAFNTAAGADGNEWYNSGEAAGRVNPDGSVSEFPFSPQSSAGERWVAPGPEGDLWFTGGPPWPNEALQLMKVTTSGAITTYTMPRDGQVSRMAEGPDGNLWFQVFRSAGNETVDRLTPWGAVTEFEVPMNFDGPEGMTRGPDGAMWFTSNEPDAIGRITTSGAFTEYPTPQGLDPEDITTGADGNLWFIASGPYENYEYRGYVGKLTPSGQFTIYSGLTEPANSITRGPDGNVWLAMGKDTGETNGFVTRVTPSGQITQFNLSKAGDPMGISAGPEGDVFWSEFSTVGRTPVNGITKPVEGPLAKPQPGTTIEYGVPLSGTGLPTMTGAEVAHWAQKDDPAEATAVIPPDSPQGWPASSYSRATIYYLDEFGRLVNISAPTSAKHGAISTTEYNEDNDVTRVLSEDARASSLEEGSEKTSAARLSELRDTQLTYNGEGAREIEVPEPGTRLIEKLGPQHLVKYVAGKEHKESLARDHQRFYYDEGAPTETTHETYDLLTKTSEEAQLANEEEVEVRATRYGYSGQAGSNAPGGIGWKLRVPTSVTSETNEGATQTHTTLYNESGQVIETRGPASTAGNSAGDVQTIYYSAGENSTYPSCGKHPEWAGLPCQTRTAKEPETAGSPKTPVTEMAYNLWNSPETITETFASAKRVEKHVYDSAGRLTGGETTATGTKAAALPAVNDEYNRYTGMLEVQSTTVSGTTTKLTSVFNTLGQRTRYTDGDGNSATYRYAGPENDDLLEEVKDGSAQGQGKQTYTYDPVSKQMTSVTDSGAGTFSASYDAEGRLVSEVYPNAMCANYSYSATGEATHVEYLKSANCAETKAPVWFRETRTPSIHGEAMSRTNTFANSEYSYDGFGRLTAVQETGAEGCYERLYEYDQESNVTSLTTRKPGSGGACATKGGSSLEHTYDEANHLIDSNLVYEELGNVTKLPASDGGKAAITTSYYVDNAVATQLQSGVTDSYSLDPEGRVRETKEAEGKTVLQQFVTHYDAPGGAVAWTGAGEKWSRNIPGIDGTLSAVQTNSGTTLQLHDLQGNTVATASLSTEATGVLSSYSSTEFGVPNGGAPPKYAWFGAVGVASERATGLVTEGATSYVPQIGKALQDEEVEPPGVPGGSGAGTRYSFAEEAWNIKGASREAAEAPGLEAGREREAAEEACRADPAACVIPEDPERILTGSGARQLAQQWKLLALSEFGALEAGWCNLCGEPTKDLVGKGVHLLGQASELLEKCYEVVHAGRWEHGSHRTYYKSGVCRVKYTLAGVLGMTILLNFGEEACWSDPRRGIENKWFCEGDQGGTWVHY